MSWGFVLLQKGKAPKRVTNVRDDKALTAGSGGRHSSSGAASCRRPPTASPRARGQPPGTGSPQRGRRPPVVRLPRRVDEVKGPVKKNGETVEQEVFAFLTTEPNELTASINHERMPVLLSEPSSLRRGSGTPERLALARHFRRRDADRAVGIGAKRPPNCSVKTGAQGTRNWVCEL